MSSPGPRSTRDLRLDLFRGMALLCVLIDHLPNNYLSRVTLKNFVLCDAGEVFVLIAGISAGTAYAYRASARQRIATRIWKIYLAQAGLILATAAVYAVFYLASGLDKFRTEPALAPFLDDLATTLVRVLVMDLQPEQVDILPLYVGLMIWLFVFLPIAERSNGAAFAISFALYLAAHALHINIPGYRNGGWHFNPFAWQFLLSIGVLIGLQKPQDPDAKPVRCDPLCLCLSWAFIAFGIAYMRPWTLLPIEVLRGTPSLPADFVALDKSFLSIGRVAQVLCLAYVASGLIPRNAAWLQRNRPARAVVMIGKAPLTSFAAASLIATIAGPVMLAFGRSVAWCLCVNAACIAAVLIVAAMKVRTVAVAAPPSPPFGHLKASRFGSSVRGRRSFRPAR